MNFDPSKLKSATSFAKTKNTSLNNVLNAANAGHLHSVQIDAQIFIIDDELSLKWAPPAAVELIEIQEEGQIIIFNVNDQLVLDNKIYFESKVMKYINGGYNKFIFNFTNSAYVDSAGIAVLTRAALHAVANGSKVQMINVGQGVRNNFKVTKLEKVIDFPDRLDEAKANLSK